MYGLPSHKGRPSGAASRSRLTSKTPIDPVYSPYVERDTLLKFAYVSPNAAPADSIITRKLRKCSIRARCATALCA